jgi:hypothetical protein
MKKRMPKDFPFDEILDKVCEIIEQGDYLVLQKFTCEHCGQRLTMDVANKIFAEGGCDKCGKMTNIEKRGCNYTLISNTPEMRKLIEQLQEPEH